MGRANLWWVRGYRLVFGLLVFGTIAYQFANRLPNASGIPANFFSYFTIECNLFAALVLLLGASGLTFGLSARTIDLVRGAAVLYLGITGVVYGLLLSGYDAELQTTIPWVNTVLHRLMPLVMVSDWLIDLPNTPITLRNGLIWLVYPLLYAVYSVVRGPIVQWHPYPFFNPAFISGYGIVTIYCIGIAVGTLFFAWLVVITGRRVRLDAVPA